MFSMIANFVCATDMHVLHMLVLAL